MYNTYSYVDRYESDSDLENKINNLEIIEALGCFLGLIGKETPRTPMIKLIIGYFILLFLCAVEGRALDWYEDRFGYTYKRVYINTNELSISSRKVSLFDIIRWIIFKKLFEDVQKMKYQIAITIIIKTVIEYLIIGGFLSSVIAKDHAIEIVFIPITTMCVISKLSLQKSYFISCYMWLWFIVQFLLLAINVTEYTVPQEVDDTIFVKVFRITDWPVYKIIFKGWNQEDEWGLYFGLAATQTTRYYFVIDLFLLAFQAVYFNIFSHSFYSLSTSVKEKKDEFIIWDFRTTMKEMGKKLNNPMKLAYKVIKNILFTYSHIFTLFCLLVMTFSTKGAINIIYLGCSILFMQYDLFAAIGDKEGSLPLLFRYALKPYIFVDLTAQFIYQVPYLIQISDSEIMACIGIHVMDEDYFSIWIKILIFIVILYQDAIYSSREYKRTSKQERYKIKSLQKKKRMCMALLYNNVRVQEFRHQKSRVTKTHEELSRLKQRIEKWNQILHRKETKANLNGEAESGLLVEIDDTTEKLIQLNNKLKSIHDNPERALANTSILDKFYLWLHSNINNVIFMNEQKLEQLEKDLIKGTHTLPNPVMDYYIKIYCENKQKKIKTEKFKLEMLKKKLEINKTGQTAQIQVIDYENKEEMKNDEIEKEYTIASVIIQNIVMLAKLGLSSTQEICFLLMIIAQIFSGNMLSMVYVLSIYCYGLVRKCRPHRIYWKMMRLYSGLVIIAKYSTMFAEDVLELNGVTDWVKEYQSECGWRIGLFEGSKRGRMYFLIFDALVLFGIIFHSYVLNILGLIRKTEEDVESLKKAMERIAKENPPREVKKIELVEEVKMLPVQEVVKTKVVPEDKESEFLKDEPINELTEENKESVEEEKKETTKESEEKKEIVEISEEKKEVAEIPEEKKEVIVYEEEKKKEEEKDKKPKKSVLSRILKKMFFSNSIGRNLFPTLKNEKPGIDYNVALISLQLILCVYIIFFWSNMTFDVTSLDNIKINEFSDLTVLALFIQITLILLERYIYFNRPLPSSTPIVLKATENPTCLEHLYYSKYKKDNCALLFRYIFHILQLILIHLMIFWYFPNDAGMRINGNPECTKEEILLKQCNEVPCNFFLIGFYSLYGLYFWLSALQIRYSWPEIEEKSLMQSSNIIGKGILQAFYAIPFAWELQQVASWLWTETSFTLFQWLKFEEIYGKIFLIKCTSKVNRTRLQGAKITKIVKLGMGGGMLFALIFLIVIPIVAFSSLNPMVELNNPTKASFSITLSYGTKNFELMEISDALIEEMSTNQAKLNLLRKFKELKAAETKQFNRLTFANSSDSYIFPTKAKLLDLHNYFNNLKVYPMFTIKYVFSRPMPTTLQHVTLEFTRVLNDEDKLKELKEFFDPDKTSAIYFNVTLSRFFCRTIILPLEGQPKPVDGWTNHTVSSADLTLILFLDDVAKKENTNILAFHVENKGEDLTLYTVSEKSRTSFLAGYSIITLYVSVVLVAGNMIRGVFSGTYYNIMYQEMPNPTPLLQLCNGVEVARYENDLVEEAELYWTLIEVLRSNELIKLITKTSREYYFFAEKVKQPPPAITELIH